MTGTSKRPKIDPALKGTTPAQPAKRKTLLGGREETDGADEAATAAAKRSQSADDLNQVDPDRRDVQPGDRGSRERNGL